MTRPDPLIVIGPDEGRLVSPRPGASARLAVSGNHTRGAYALVEWTHQPGIPGPPLHAHAVEEEAFYVLDGTLQVQTTTAKVTLEPGGYCLVPRTTFHTFAVPGTTACRFLIILSPPGYEEFFAALADAVAGGTQPPTPQLMQTVGDPFRLTVHSDALDPHRGT